jgi:hypothetical protein
MKTAPLGSMFPATESSAPASRNASPGRARTTRASQTRPMTAISAAVRIRLRSTLLLLRRIRRRTGTPGGPADELHTTGIVRCHRGLIATSCASPPLRVSLSYAFAHVRTWGPTRKTGDPAAGPVTYTTPDLQAFIGSVGGAPEPPEVIVAQAISSPDEF